MDKKRFYCKNFSSKKKILSYPLIKEDTLLIKKLKGKNFGLVTVGQIKTPNLRIKIFSKMKEYGFKPATVISSNSKIYKNVKIGEGTIIMNGVIINPNVKIDKNCEKIAQPDFPVRRSVGPPPPHTARHPLDWLHIVK